MTTLDRIEPPLTLLNGLISATDSVQGIGKVMEYIAQSTFAMWTAGTDNQSDCTEGLYYLIEHLASLQSQAVEQLKNEAVEASHKSERLAQLEHLHALYQAIKNEPTAVFGETDTHQQGEAEIAASVITAEEIAELENSLFGATSEQAVNR